MIRIVKTKPKRWELRTLDGDVLLIVTESKSEAHWRTVALLATGFDWSGNYETLHKRAQALPRVVMDYMGGILKGEHDYSVPPTP